MIALDIFLIIIGALLIIKPSFVWLITESWKSNDETKPSGLYIWSTRFGGIMFTLVGIGVVIVSFL